MPQRSGEDKPWRSVERFDCDILCADVTGWVDGKRSERGCTRVELEPVPWHVSPQRIRVAGYMGRQRLAPGTQFDEDGLPVRWKYPPELAAEGCPGGWYRCRFVLSLLEFMRTRAEGGMRVPNPFFDRCEDDLVLALVMHLEHEQERWESWRWEQMSGGG